MTFTNLHVLAAGPAAHEAIIMSAAWTEPVAYDDAGTILTWELDDRVPLDATALALRIKLKCYIPNGEGPAYCQGNVRFVNDDAVMNHFAHVDEWGRGPNNSGEGRRIQYVSLFAPVKDGAVSLLVSHEIAGRGNVEVVVYLEGFVTIGELALVPTNVREVPVA